MLSYEFGVMIYDYMLNAVQFKYRVSYLHDAFPGLSEINK